MRNLLLVTTLAVGIAEGKVYDHLKGTYTGQRALGFKQWIGNVANNPNIAREDCVWRWHNDPSSVDGYMVPVWECPHCDQEGTSVFLPTGLRRCNGQTISTLQHLTNLNANCDWISGSLSVHIDGAVELHSILRITGNLILGDEVISFTAPKLMVIMGLDIRGASLIACDLPALESICAGTLSISPTSRLPYLRAPLLGEQSSFELVVDSVGVDMDIDIGSVNGGPHTFLNRFILTTTGAARLNITGLRNLRYAKLEPVKSIMRMRGIRGTGPCPLHGARVVFSSPSMYPLGEFTLDTTEYTECSPTMSTATRWSSVKITNNPNLRYANIPANILTKSLTVTDNVRLRTEFEHIQQVLGNITLSGVAPPPPHNVVLIPHLEHVGESLRVDYTTNLTRVDLGSATGGPTRILGTLSLTCQLSCGELRGLTRLGSVDSVSPTDYVRVEGFTNIGRVSMAETIYGGAKSEVTFKRNNWETLWLARRNDSDTWGSLTIMNNPYLESLAQPINWDASRVGPIVISKNPMLPQKCTSLAVWQKAVIQTGNHPNATLPCPG